MGSDARNISAVLINGEVRKWNGQVANVGLPALRDEVHTSRRWRQGQAHRRQDGTYLPAKFDLSSGPVRATKSSSTDKATLGPPWGVARRTRTIWQY